MPQIHPTAIVAKGAKIGEGTTVGPYAIIGAQVVIGANNKIDSHVVIDGLTIIGNENNIFPFAAVGLAPQDLKFKGEGSRLEIGNKNTIREYVTLQPGTAGGGMLTKIGNGNLFMANTHVGHDCIIGDGNIFANSAALSGHVTVGNFATFGGLSGIHQFVRIGDLAFLGGGSMVVKDIPPFCMAQGDRAGLAGLNLLGLERRGFKAEEIAALKKMYRQIFLGKGILKDRLQSARQEFSEYPQAVQLLDFIAASERGVVLHRKGAGGE